MTLGKKLADTGEGSEPVKGRQARGNRWRKKMAPVTMSPAPSSSGRANRVAQLPRGLAVRPVLVPELPEPELPELGEADEPPELLEPSFPLERVGAGREVPLLLPPLFERV